MRVGRECRRAALRNQLGSRGLTPHRGRAWNFIRRLYLRCYAPPLPASPPLAMEERARQKARRGGAPDQRRGLDEVAAVADQVPVAREAPQPLHRREINQPVLQDFVGRVRVIDHLPFGVVPDDRRAAQPLEDAHLDFLRAERDQAVEARGKTLQALARQAGDQIGVDVDAGFARAGSGDCPPAARNPAGA